MSGRRALVIGSAVVVALALLAGTGAGLWLGLAGDDGESVGGATLEATAEVPRMVAGHRLQGSAIGAEAGAAVDELHGLPIEVEDGWIGEYEDGGSIWVARMESEEKADELVDRMTAAIEDGTPFFINLQRQEVGNLVIYTVEGGGQLHYYYQLETQAIWVTAPAGDEGAFFHEALEAVR
jgi:hypothetical protein